MPDTFKKILIISSYAPPAIGGPQNLYNLLRDFPQDRYSILTSFYNIDNLSAKVGTWLPCEYVFYDNPKANKEMVQKEVIENVNYTKRKRIVENTKFLMKRFALIRALVGMPVIFGQIFAIVRQGKKTIKDKKIQTLIGVSDYGPAMLGTFILHKITGKPFSLFLFDLYKGNFFPFPGGLLASLFEKTIFKNAEKIIVTNQGTKDVYTKLYGDVISKKITIIHNSVFPEAYIKLQDKNSDYDPKAPYTILFTGRIYWPQIGALKNLIQAVNEIDSLYIQFKIYSPSPKPYLESIGIKESKKVKILVAPPEEMAKVQGQADILFLPLSWHTRSQEIIDTATPGKLTDYLIAGKPILIHAPASTFLVAYAKENGFALTVEEENIQKLKDAMDKILTDKNFSKDLIKNAQKTFFEKHNANNNALIFKDLFLS